MIEMIDVTAGNSRYIQTSKARDGSEYRCFLAILAI